MTCGRAGGESWPTPAAALSPRSPAHIGPHVNSCSPSLRRSVWQRSGGPPATAAPPLDPPKARPRPLDAVARCPGGQRPIRGKGGLLSFAGGPCRSIRQPSALRCGGIFAALASCAPCSLPVLPTHPYRRASGTSGGPTSGQGKVVLLEAPGFGSPAVASGPPAASCGSAW